MIYSRPASKDCPFPVARGDLLNSRLKTGGNRSKIRPPGRITVARKAGGDKRPDVLRSVVLRQRPPASAGRGLWQISRFRRAVKERHGTAPSRNGAVPRGRDGPPGNRRAVYCTPARPGRRGCVPAEAGTAWCRQWAAWNRQVGTVPAMAGVRGGGGTCAGQPIGWPGE